MRHKVNKIHSLLPETVGIALLSLSSIAQACLPASPNDVFMGRINTSTTQFFSETPDNQTTFTKLSVNESKFVFRPFDWLALFQSIDGWQTRLPLDSLHDDSLIIGLAYDANGGDDKNIYTIENFALLTCKNNIISVSEPVVKNYGWNRENESCSHDDPAGVGILDGFVDNDEVYYLAQLHDKYPTCASLESAFPVVEVNDATNSQTNLSFWNRVKGWFGW